MQLLIISDTHGKDKLLRGLLTQYKGRVHAVLHLGDHDHDLLRLAGETALPLYAVAGNCDDGVLSPRELLQPFGAFNVFMTHGNRLGVNEGMIRIILRAREVKAAVCLFGHTHCNTVFCEQDILFMNPGSLTDPRDKKPPSYGLLQLNEETGKASAEILHL